MTILTTSLCSVFALLLATPAPASGARVFVVNGNIVVLQANGMRFQITESGKDSDPDLAEDGSKIVFVRRTGDESSEIWLADADGKTRPQPLVKTPIEVNNRRFNQVFTPRFSPNARLVYFLIPYAGTTGAIVKADVSAPRPEFVAAALNFRIVPSGKYAGDLIAQIRKAKLALGYYEWYWLLTPEGQEIGVVGQDEHDVEQFLTEQAVPGNK